MSIPEEDIEALRKKLYPEDERRSNDSIALSVMLQIHKDVKATDEKLTQHMIHEEETGARRITAAVALAMNSAFPEGDASGHRRHHEAVIKQAEDKAAFWSKMRFELSRAGLIGFGLWAVWALVKAIIAEARQ